MTEKQTEMAVTDAQIRAIVESSAGRKDKVSVLSALGVDEAEINRLLPTRRGGMQADIKAIEDDILANDGKSTFLAEVSGKTGDDRLSAAIKFFEDAGLVEKQYRNPVRHLALRVSAASAIERAYAAGLEAGKATASKASARQPAKQPAKRSK